MKVLRDAARKAIPSSNCSRDRLINVGLTKLCLLFHRSPLARESELSSGLLGSAQSLRRSPGFVLMKRLLYRRSFRLHRAAVRRSSSPNIPPCTARKHNCSCSKLEKHSVRIFCQSLNSPASRRRESVHRFLAKRVFGDFSPYLLAIHMSMKKKTHTHKVF